MSKSSKSAPSGDIRRLLRSHGDAPDANLEQDTREQQTQDISRDLSNIFATLSTISNDVKGIEEIRRTTTSMEEKLSTLMTRLSDVEARLDYLEQGEQERQANPVATKEDLRLVWDKLEDLENRSRRNNVRFIGIPEGKEDGDTTSFIEKLIPTLLGLEKKCEIDRAHRVPTQQPQPGDRPRPILARFLRSSDRDLVLRTARERGKLNLGNNNIMLFPDYSKATQQRRDKFKECKKKLHEREVGFRMLFPAKLLIHAKEGSKTFDCPRKALSYIEAIE